jgi:hypothetical protein
MSGNVRPMRGASSPVNVSPAELDGAVWLRHEREDALTNEEAERHPTAPDHPPWRVEGRNVHRKRAARVESDVERDPPPRGNAAVDFGDGPVPLRVARRVRQN